MISVGLGLAVGGFAWWVDSLGADLLDQAIGPLVVLGNLPGPWLAAGFFAGATQQRMTAGVVAGTAALGIGVATYYGLSWMAAGHPTDSIAPGLATVWLLVSLAAGAALGAAGMLSKLHRSRWSAAGLAVLTGGLLAEAALLTAAVSPYRALQGTSATIVAVGEAALSVTAIIVLERRHDYVLALASSLGAGIVMFLATSLAIVFVQALVDGLTVGQLGF